MNKRRSGSSRSAAVAMIAAGSLVASAHAGIAPVGSPIIVQHLPPSYSGMGGFARNTSGQFVVAIQESVSTGTQLHVRSYDAQGKALSADIKVATLSGNLFSGIAMNDDGAFVVYWALLSADDPDNFIMAQEFSATGNALGAPVRVVDFGASPAEPNVRSQSPSIAIASNGDFVLGWTLDTNQVTYTGSGCNSIPQAWTCMENESFSYSTYARIFHADGGTGTGLLTVNQSALQEVSFSADLAPPANAFSERGAPGVAVDSSGNFDISYSAQNGSNQEIHWASYAVTGSLQHQTLVATVGPKLLVESPIVAMNDAGQAVVEWGQNQGTSSKQQIESQSLQPLEADGSFNGAVVTLNAATIAGTSIGGRNAIIEDLKMDSAGNFGLAWYAFVLQNNIWTNQYYEQDYVASGKANGAAVQLATPASTVQAIVSIDHSLAATILDVVSGKLNDTLQVQQYSSP